MYLVEKNGQFYITNDEAGTKHAGVCRIIALTVEYFITLLSVTGI
jgi:hypothetical protein